MELIPIALQKGKLNYHNRSFAPLSIETGLSDDEQRNSLPVGRTANAQFENGVLIDWVHDARRPTEFTVLRVTASHLSVSAFLQAAMIPARHDAYVFPNGRR